MQLKFDESKNFDLITLGRACIDLNANEYNKPMEETISFTKYVGGSPANIAIGSAKLGLKTGFIGKVAKDQHGQFIKNYMNVSGVDTSHILFDDEGHKTGLAFTEIKSPDECSILMYRDEVADLYLKPTEIDEAYIKQTKTLLVSGTALSKSPSREAVLKAISLAKANRVKVTFELDYRPYTWTSEEETAIYYKAVAEQSDIVIGTREEFDVLERRGNSPDEKTVSNLFNYEPKLIIIKHGISGSFAYLPSGEAFRAGIYKTKVLNTFGAGDSYAAAFLHGLLRGLDLKTTLEYASAAAAIVVSRHSSSAAMPDLEEIRQLVLQEAE